MVTIFPTCSLHDLRYSKRMPANRLPMAPAATPGGKPAATTKSFGPDSALMRSLFEPEDSGASQPPFSLTNGPTDSARTPGPDHTFSQKPRAHTSSFVDENSALHKTNYTAAHLSATRILQPVPPTQPTHIPSSYSYLDSFTRYSRDRQAYSSTATPSSSNSKPAAVSAAQSTATPFKSVDSALRAPLKDIQRSAPSNNQPVTIPNATSSTGTDSAQHALSTEALRSVTLNSQTGPLAELSRSAPPFGQPLHLTEPPRSVPATSQTVQPSVASVEAIPTVFLY